MMLGLTIVWLLVIGTQDGEGSFRPVTALWIIAVPLIDMFAVMHRRVRKGKSPLSADRDHIHHIFMRFGFSSRQACALIGLISVALAGVGLAGEYFSVPEPVMLFSFIGLFLAYDYAFLHVWRFSKWMRG
ncbi:hypothetical protein ACFQMB_06175 [Pseudobowmanella zhangzhouensis]